MYNAGYTFIINLSKGRVSPIVSSYFKPAIKEHFQLPSHPPPCCHDFTVCVDIFDWTVQTRTRGRHGAHVPGGACSTVSKVTNLNDGSK